MAGQSKIPDERQLDALAEFRYQLRRFLRFSEDTTAEAGLRAQQYQLMQVVAAASKEGPPTIVYVADRMLLRHNSAVELIDRTAEQGLLRRVPDKEDHRKTRLKLSAKGERVLAKLIEKHLVQFESDGDELRHSLDRVMETILAVDAAKQPIEK